MTSKIDKDWRTIYNALASQHGQLMTPAEVEHQVGFKLETARKVFPLGWTGSGRSLRMKTVVLAQQIAEL